MGNIGNDMDLGLQDIAYIVAILSGIVGGVIGIWRLGRTQASEFEDVRKEIGLLREEFTNKLDKIEDSLHNTLQEHDKDGASKRKAIYERIEDGERRTDEKYVRQDTCKILHGALKEATGEIASDVKKLLRG